jgi:hypothetical protein
MQLEDCMMATVRVHWDNPTFEIGRGIQAERQPRLFGELTAENSYAREGKPVLVEEITKKVYLPSDLPAGTTLELATDATEMPEVARQAQKTGYRVVRPS